MRNEIIKVKIQFVSIYSNSNSIRVYKVSMAILPQYHCPTLVPRPHSFHLGLPQDFLLFPTCQFSLLICLWWNLKTKVIDLKNRFPRDLLERPLNQEEKLLCKHVYWKDLKCCLTQLWFWRVLAVCIVVFVPQVFSL